MRLVMGGPTLQSVPASFAVDLAQLYATTRESGPWASITMGFLETTHVHLGRELVLEQALKCQATHVLWLDTDMAFPPETAVRLARHDQAVVGGNCVTRDPRRLFTAVRDGRRIATTPASTGLEAVDSVGLAVLLVRLDVVADLARPWFAWGRDATGAVVGEDVGFCRALRLAGQTIWIDHDLSKEIGHVGQFTYRPAPAPVPV
jgi:hypothetical protein